MNANLRTDQLDWLAAFRFKRAIRASKKRIAYRPKEIGPYMLARVRRTANTAFIRQRGPWWTLNCYPSPWRRL